MPTKEDKHTHKHIDHESSDGDCTCELLDTSLSGVGDSDCSCSECLEANLQAFNQLKQNEQWLEKQNENKQNRGNSTRITTNKQTRGASRNTDQFQSKTQSRLNSYKSLDKYGPNRSHTAVNRTQKQTKNVDQQMAEDSAPQFSKESMNDFIKITQYRAREYLQQRRKLKKGEIQERQKLKNMIKQNLQTLKYSAKAIREQQKKDGEEASYEWNHRPYHCKSRVQCRKIIPYEPNLEQKADQIRQIKERIRKYKQQNKKQDYECPDQCPRHHTRTSKKKIAQIQKFIKQKAKAYEKQRKLQQKQKIKKQKVLQAKLRAIDIKCKNIVTKSKKIDPSISRTSFHNSIDHFSTFSQLKQFKQQRQFQKENKRKINKALNEKGGILQDQIYENLQDCLIGDHPPIHSYIGTQSRKDPRQKEETEQWCQKIVYDARLKPPKQIKKDEKSNKDAKTKYQKVKQDKTKPKVTESAKSKGIIEKNIKKQEQRRKQIQMEIQRKKQQIYKQYQKRNSNIKDSKDSSKNQKLRQSYEQKIKQKKIPESGKSSKKQQSYDSYRQVYKHQPSSDPRQLEVNGDPLMQQYEYQRNMGRFKQLQIDDDHQIFTKSGSNLKGKPVLYI